MSDISYRLVEEKTVKRSRKEHRCVWCGQIVFVASSYVRVRAIVEGDPQTECYHLECREASATETHETEGEFEPYVNERPNAAGFTPAQMAEGFESKLDTEY